ncbi:MAG TPA: HigA family addiction module antitoxin [Candidatus Binataceae bacterium]|nr:HigA family addiction module antitoxin [Candidatus Binataceae bacterium]
MPGTAGFNSHRGGKDARRHAPSAQQSPKREKSGISPEMAVRLAKAFGSSAETWLGVQMDYDLAEVRRRDKQINVKRVKALPRLQQEHA